MKNDAQHRKTLSIKHTVEQPPIDRLHLLQIQASYEAGFYRCAETLGLLKPYLSLNQCYKRWGRKTVERWAAEGLISIEKDGTKNSRCRVSRERVELVASMSNRASWYGHNE